jgi:hypothetical protein
MAELEYTRIEPGIEVRTIEIGGIYVTEIVGGDYDGNRYFRETEFLAIVAHTVAVEHCKGDVRTCST